MTVVTWAMPRDSRADFPIAGMVSFEREFLEACHREAHVRAMREGQPPVPCVRCGRDYSWHAITRVYWNDRERVS